MLEEASPCKINNTIKPDISMRVLRMAYHKKKKKVYEYDFNHVHFEYVR